MTPDVFLLVRGYCGCAFIPRQAIHRHWELASNSTDHRERIVAAAVQHNGKLYTGKRHGLIMQQIWAEAEAASQPSPTIPFEAQGFVDDRGRFWNRFQAGAIAYHSGQTSTRKEHLLSEDLW